MSNSSFIDTVEAVDIIKRGGIVAIPLHRSTITLAALSAAFVRVRFTVVLSGQYMSITLADEFIPKVNDHRNQI